MISNRFNPNHERIEGVARGAPRQFLDADRLDLIDRNILPLIQGMNALTGLDTVACCQGHGFLGRYSAPYVAFTAPKSTACAFQMALENEVHKTNPRLKYFWDMDARFQQNGELIYRVRAPSLDRHIWVTRKDLDADFMALLFIFQESFKGQ